MDRYANDGSFAGNTWHPTWADAVSQIQFEYESDLIFNLVPATIDPKTYAQNVAADG